MKYMLLVLCLFSTFIQAQFVGNTAVCLNPNEKELFDRLNQYRAANGKTQIPNSFSLSSVSQWHTWDVITNNPVVAPCNAHSWSNARPSLWTPVCYLPDHSQATGMWYKPQEITNNVYSGLGFEISVFGGTLTPEIAMQRWINSPAHNDVILNNGVWAPLTWRGVGVGMVGDIANIWFGEMTDPVGSMPVCTAPSLFSDGFEGQ